MLFRTLDEKKKNRNDCALFFCASFSSLSLVSAKREFGIYVRVGDNTAFFNSFFFFFTCFSNARWKMPTRRMGAGLEHPFP